VAYGIACEWDDQGCAGREEAGIMPAFMPLVLNLLEFSTK